MYLLFAFFPASLPDKVPGPGLVASKFSFPLFAVSPF